MRGMIIVPMDLEPGFRKADIHNIPALNSGMVYNFCLSGASEKSKQMQTDRNDLLTDYVQVRRHGDVCELKALVFSATDFANTVTHANVALKVVESAQMIMDGQCSLCTAACTCAHIVAFTFWLLNKSTDRNPSAVVEFWGHELENLVQPEPTTATRICDIIPKDEVRMESELNSKELSASEGEAFLVTILNELADCGRDSALYRQCVETTDEFEPMFVHHVLLRANEYNVVDPPSYVQHMEAQAHTGIIETLYEATRNKYKSRLWVEVQYMRIRCSMMHMIISRKSSEDDDQIFNMMFCKGRDKNNEDRVQQKEHKRFILKQTEKLENKNYLECGLILHESFPFLCAAPDGITDDHIVEIKSPKTDEDFEKYLEARESIAPKYMAQIQIQMFAANVKKALYCVLSPTFESNGALHYVWVQADPEFVSSLLSMAEDFWRDVVFPRLLNIYPQCPGQ
ncbi:uncharacterized protein LOC6734681 [Drosophila simulans]|uniref:GD11147 n=1 Tax=Drosophila simulans TaxID=7240 RepID=B4QHC8_DROSI|nr:uncharacterized protein LOC6734681 [Drosophila simulans]EDX07273.1 GD11147 [Drosophila simulans]KMY94129.1 uncharacterized protein Dsimw501_GD11147 [Drosophila simulans]